MEDAFGTSSASRDVRVGSQGEPTRSQAEFPLLEVHTFTRDSRLASRIEFALDQADPSLPGYSVVGSDSEPVDFGRNPRSGGGLGDTVFMRSNGAPSRVPAIVASDRMTFSKGFGDSIKGSFGEFGRVFLDDATGGAGLTEEFPKRERPFERFPPVPPNEFKRLQDKYRIDADPESAWWWHYILLNLDRKYDRFVPLKDTKPGGAAPTFDSIRDRGVLGGPNCDGTATRFIRDEQGYLPIQLAWYRGEEVETWRGTYGDLPEFGRDEFQKWTDKSRERIHKAKDEAAKVAADWQKYIATLETAAITGALERTIASEGIPEEYLEQAVNDAFASWTCPANCVKVVEMLGHKVLLRGARVIATVDQVTRPTPAPSVGGYFVWFEVRVIALIDLSVTVRARISCRSRG